MDIEPREIVQTILRPFRQWERLRNPYAGWTRVVLGVLLPFALWSHDGVLIVLYIAAAIGHPWCFPPYIEAGEDAPLMTRLTDAFHEWVDTTSREDKIAALFAPLALALPVLWFPLAHNLFWTVYFFAAAAACKYLFIRNLMEEKGV